jgi:hypothetical protein
MSDPRHNHKFDSDQTKKTAERRIHELSKPGERMTMTAYLNALIAEDGKRHPKPKRTP